MSGHNVLQEVLDAEHTLISPALNETASIDRSPALLVSEVNCKIAVPQRAGIRLSVFSVSGCTITAESGNFYTSNTAGTEATSITLGAHDVVDLISVANGSVFQFKRVN